MVQANIRNADLRQIHWNPERIKVTALEVPSLRGISELVRNNSRISHHLVIALVSMAVDPKRRLAFLNDLDHVERIEGGPYRAVSEFCPRIHRGRVVADH